MLHSYNTRSLQKIAEENTPRKKWKRLKRRAGDILVNSLIGIAIAAVFGSIGFSTMGPAMQKANEHKLRTALESYTMAVQNIIISNSNICRFTASNPSNAADQLIDLLNQELSDDDKITRVTDNGDSGLVGYTKRNLDPYKNPYGVYVYWADKGSTYRKNSTEDYGASDSVVNICIVSAGPNGTGGPAGINGLNIKQDTKEVLSAAAAVNNSDALDDRGIIIQIANGSASAQYFGMSKVGVGALTAKQWVFGIPSTTGGIIYNYFSSVEATATSAGSIAKYFNEDIVNGSDATVIGAM